MYRSSTRWPRRRLPPEGSLQRRVDPVSRPRPPPQVVLVPADNDARRTPLARSRPNAARPGSVRPPRQRHRRIRAEQHVAHGPGDLEDRPPTRRPTATGPGRRPRPARRSSAAASSRSRSPARTRPPSSSSRGPSTLSASSIGSVRPISSPAVQHGELRRGGEHRRQPHEVPVPEPLLGLRPDEQHPAVLLEEPLLRPGTAGSAAALRSKRRQPAAIPATVCSPIRCFLQAQGEQLLGDDVPRLRRRHDRLDVTLRPTGEQQPGREQQGVLVQREEQAVPRGARPPPGAPEPLQERRDASAGR